MKYDLFLLWVFNCMHIQAYENVNSVNMKGIIYCYLLWISLRPTMCAFWVVEWGLPNVSTGLAAKSYHSNELYAGYPQRPAISLFFLSYKCKRWNIPYCRSQLFPPLFFQIHQSFFILPFIMQCCLKYWFHTEFLNK